MPSKFTNLFRNLAAAGIIAASAPIAAQSESPAGSQLAVRVIAPEEQTTPMPTPNSAPHELLTESGEGLAVEDLQAVALANNPAAAQAAARIRALRGQWIQVGLCPNPRIGYQGLEIGNEDTAGMQGGFFSQEFVTGGKRQLAREVVDRQIQEAEQLLAATQFRIRTDVEITFFRVLAAQQNVAYAEQVGRIGGESTEAAKRLYEAQQVSLADLLQAQIVAEQAAIALANAHNQEHGAWRQMLAVLGVDIPRQSLKGHLEEDLPQLDWDEALARLLAESPELAAANARAAAASRAIELARKQVVPNVDVMIGAQHDNMTTDDFANVEIAVPLPLWNKNQGGIMTAQAELTAACSEIERIRRQLQSRLALAFEQFANSRLRVERYRTVILPNARTNLDLSQAGYRQGELSYLNLLTAQRTLFESQITYVQSLRELHETAALIRGLLLTGSLDESAMRR